MSADVGSPFGSPLELEDLISLSVEPARVRQARPLMKGRRSPWPGNSMTFAVTALADGLSRSNGHLRTLHRGLHVSGHSTRDIRLIGAAIRRNRLASWTRISGYFAGLVGGERAGDGGRSAGDQARAPGTAWRAGPALRDCARRASGD